MVLRQDCSEEVEAEASLNRRTEEAVQAASRLSARAARDIGDGGRGNSWGRWGGGNGGVGGRGGGRSGGRGGGGRRGVGNERPEVGGRGLSGGPVRSNPTLGGWTGKRGSWGLTSRTPILRSGRVVFFPHAYMGEKRERLSRTRGVKSWW